MINMLIPNYSYIYMYPSRTKRFALNRIQMEEIAQ